MLLKTLLTIISLSVAPVLGNGQFPRTSTVVGGHLPSLPTSLETPAIRFAQTDRTNNTVGTLRVTENSGVCETTPGVYQASGYADIAANKSLFFWYFDARHDPDNAPLTLWLSGGPGVTSMDGLYGEIGPCKVRNDSSGADLNSQSWNEHSNIIFIDQPIGTGFSHGTLDVKTTEEAAVDIWTFFQVFFSDKRFAKLATREFGLWTESYGGHYGPVFSAHFLDMNKAIANGTMSDTPINLKYLGIGNGLVDPLPQYDSFLKIAASNPYHPTADKMTLALVDVAHYGPLGCHDQIQACYNTGDVDLCILAHVTCNNAVLFPLIGNYSPYDVRVLSSDVFPPDIAPVFTSELRAKIGAETEYVDLSTDVFTNFFSTGDWMRNKRPALESVINAGVRTIMYAGDADYICNYMGYETVVGNLQTRFTQEYREQNFTEYKVAGQVAGLYKNAGTFSYLRVYGAGHQVPAYSYGSFRPGQVALQMFTQIMQNKSLSST